MMDEEQIHISAQDDVEIMIPGYLGIDIGTQGLTVLFTDIALHVLASGEASYDFVQGLDDGCYEQNTTDWEDALRDAMQQVRTKVPNLCVNAIGISGQMHGEVLADENGCALGTVRLWCDARNEQEGHELTELFQSKVPKRATAARFLWTARNEPDIAAKVKHITTPAGWIAYKLTGEWNLGIGDAAGMFPIDQNTHDYDKSKLVLFDQLVNNDAIAGFGEILPQVRKAGEDGGWLCETGQELLGIDRCVPVAPAEGDQVAALAGSLIGKSGIVSCSFGTSVCSNAVGDDRNFQGVSPAVDHFCAADGKPINMVWLRNGTTFLNSMVESHAAGLDKTEAFSLVMPQLLAAEPECGGILALPFMDDEPGLGVSSGRSALVLGLNATNNTPGNVAKAALLSTIFNLRLGCEVLDQQGYPRDELVLSGGLTKTPECAQILADVFNSPVTLLESAEEGCSWGAAVLASYRSLRVVGLTTSWVDYLDEIDVGRNKQRYEPDHDAVRRYGTLFSRYRKLLALQPQLAEIVE